jgi:hypothetical protein
MLPRVIQQHRDAAFNSLAPNVQRITAGKATRIYDLQRSTAVSAEWPTVTEVLGGTALTQTDTDRKPAAATSANGLNVATFDGTDVLLQTLESGNNGTTKWWFYFRVKFADLAAQQQVYAAMVANGASANRSRIAVPSSGRISFDIFMAGFNGRNYLTAGSFSAGVWQSGYVVFDSTKTSEADTTGSNDDAKVRVALGNTFQALTAADVGTPGGVPSALLAATGVTTLFAATDSDTPSSPLRNGGQTQLMAFGSEPLTAAELAALNLFQFPT